MNRALRLAGYVGWFLLCFTIAAVLMFPVAGLKPLVVEQAERALGKGKQGKNGVDPIVTIGELSTSGLGIKAKRLQVQLASSNPDPGPVFDFDSLWVSASLLSLVSPNKTLQLDADLYKGDASAQITVNEKRDVTAALIEVDDVELATVPAFIAALGVPVEGTLDADIDLKIGSATEKDTQGKIAITIANLSIGAGRLTQGFPGGLELSEAVSLGTLKLRVPVDKGQGTIDFSQEGSPAMEFDVDGTMTLRGHLPQSRLDIDGWFRPTQAFLDKTPAIKSAIELGEKLSIPGAPSLTKAKDGEGRYHFLAKGILQTLRPQLARDSGRRSRTKAAPSTPAPTTEPVAAPEPTPAPPRPQRRSRLNRRGRLTGAGPSSCSRSMSRSMVGAACGLLIIAASGCFHVTSKLPGVLDLRSDGGDCVVDIRIVRIKKAPLAGKPAKVADDDVRPSTKTAAAQRF